MPNSQPRTSSRNLRCGAQSSPAAGVALARPMPLTPEVAFEQHRERLLSVIYLRMGPNLRVRMDPEDVLQEVAIEAVNSWHTLSDEQNAGAWLVTLARRKVARILRDQIGVAARDPRRERTIKTELPLADRRSGPVTHADRKDRLELLEQAIQRLSEDHRDVILLMKIDGLSAKEVAEQMGRTENAVHLLLSRALKRLAEELKL
ncbi:MAG: RNA polymerase sigma factor [Planctomycetota bacterium]